VEETAKGERRRANIPPQKTPKYHPRGIFEEAGDE